MLVRHCRSRDRIVVSTLRCGRNNPGSNPGHGRANFVQFKEWENTFIFSRLISIHSVHTTTVTQTNRYNSKVNRA